MGYNYSTFCRRLSDSWIRPCSPLSAALFIYGNIVVDWFQIQSGYRRNCLTYSQTRSQGTRLHLAPCRSGQDSSWRWTQGNQLMHRGTSKCLTLLGTKGSWRNPVGLASCDSSNTFQQWTCQGAYIKWEFGRIYLLPRYNHWSAKASKSLQGISVPLRTWSWKTFRTNLQICSSG